MPLDPDQFAARVARDVPPGSFVNLGIGQPTKVADYLPAETGVVLHTENGMLGMGPAAVGDEVDPDLTNAGKVPVTELPGAAYFRRCPDDVPAHGRADVPDVGPASEESAGW